MKKCATCDFMYEDVYDGCPQCAARAHNTAGDQLLRMVAPVQRSGWAIAAGYLGLISVLVLPAPFAVATGIIAIMDIREHPDRHGMGRAIFGIVAGGLVCALVAYGYITMRLR